MIGRRALLSLFGAGAAGAASGARVEVGEAHLGDMATPVDGYPIPKDVVERPAWQSRLRDRIWKLRRERLQSDMAMPVHIAGKKSWSPVFKQMTYYRELREFEELERKTNEDAAFAERLAKLMGVL